MSLLRLRLIQIFDEDELDKDLEVIGEKVSRKNRSEIRRLIGVAVKHADPGVAAAIDVFRTGNVFKIKSLAEDQLADINRILADSFGERVEAVRDKIQERFGVTKSKATLLARDQTLTLNAQITKMRHQNLGITHYIWTSSADERVREIHSELDGTVQSWAAPPVVSPDGRTGHPGEDYQCRCTAFPVLPELS